VKDDVAVPVLKHGEIKRGLLIEIISEAGLTKRAMRIKKPILWLGKFNCPNFFHRYRSMGDFLWENFYA
jgi:hypothetical protein